MVHVASDNEYQLTECYLLGLQAFYIVVGDQAGHVDGTSTQPPHWNTDPSVTC